MHIALLAHKCGNKIIELGLVSTAAEANRLANRLRAAVRTSRTAEGQAATASIGIALARPVEGEEATEAVWRLIDRADAAMYSAKEQGRDRVAAMLPRPRGSRSEEASVPGSRASDVA